MVEAAPRWQPPGYGWRSPTDRRARSGAVRTAYHRPGSSPRRSLYLRNGPRDEGGRRGRLPRRRDDPVGTGCGGPAGDPGAVADRHRRPSAQNAKVLPRGGAAVVIEERELTGERLARPGGAARGRRRGAAWATRATWRGPDAAARIARSALNSFAGAGERSCSVRRGGSTSSASAASACAASPRCSPTWATRVGLGHEASAVTDRLASLGVTVASGTTPRMSATPTWSSFRRRSAGQPRGRGARAADPGDSARRDARRADAAEVRDRGRRRARQDHDDVDDALVLERAGLDPTAVIGGRLSAFGSNARLGQGEYMVAEADESDGSFLKLSPSIAVITNIDREHMDAYGSFADLQQAFIDFANKVPFYGAVVACADDAELCAVLPRFDAARHHLRHRRRRTAQRVPRLRVDARSASDTAVRVDSSIDRRGGTRRRRSASSRCRCPGRHTRC